MKKKCAVLDLDGVILDSAYLLKEMHDLGLKGEKMWEHFYTNCNSDRTQLIESALELFRILYDANLTVIFSTARNEKCMEETTRKLWSYGICFEKLYMRKDGDLRPSYEVKKDHLKEILKEYDVALFVDDDLSNCEMAKELGVLALRKV